MRRFISRYFGFFWQDLVKGTRISSTTTFLEETQNWSQKEVEEYQFHKLRTLVLHAYKYVPYYRKLFDTHSINPERLDTWEDFRRIPVLTKKLALEAGKDLFATNVSKKIKKGKTGGTTGVPLYLRRDANTRSFTWGAYYRWYRHLGIKKGDPIVELWGSPQVLQERLYTKLRKAYLYYFQNTLVINSFDLSEDTFPQYLKRIIKFRPKVIRGYLSSIIFLAEYVEKKNVKLENLEIITTTSETLYPYYREYLERVFGRRVYNQYGCGECGSIAFELGETNELNITQEHVIIETVDEEGVPFYNKPGRILLTDLDNYAMVFLRYENGDIATMGSGDIRDSNKGPTLKEILGREKDTIILKNGSNVHGVFFTDIFYELNNSYLNSIVRFQVYQDTPGDIDFRIESKKQIQAETIHILKESLEIFFRKVDISIFESLPGSESGKYKYIISDIQDD